MGYGKVLASSAERFNLALPEGGYPTVGIETLAGQMLSIDPAFVGALGAKTGFNSENTGRLDFMGTGARIVQDVVTPNVPKLTANYPRWSSPNSIDSSSLSAMAESLNLIFGSLQNQINNTVVREETRDKYAINYKNMLSWTASGGTLDEE